MLAEAAAGLFPARSDPAASGSRATRRIRFTACTGTSTSATTRPAGGSSRRAGAALRLRRLMPRPASRSDPRDPAMPLTPDDFGGPGRDREPMEGDRPRRTGRGPKARICLRCPKGGTTAVPDRPGPTGTCSRPGPWTATSSSGGTQRQPLGFAACPRGCARQSGRSNPSALDLPPSVEASDPPANTLSGPVEAPLLALPDPAAPAASNANHTGALAPGQSGDWPSRSNFSGPGPSRPRVSLLGSLFGGGTDPPLNGRVSLDPDRDRSTSARRSHFPGTACGFSFVALSYRRISSERLGAGRGHANRIARLAQSKGVRGE